MRGTHNKQEPALEYENDHKNEAVRFLCAKLDATPLIRGISDEERLQAWTEVAKDLDVTGRQRRALRLRHQALDGDGVEVEAAFEPASSVESVSTTEPVADGGANVGTAEEAAQRASPEQETMEYANDAEFASQKRKAERICRMFESVDAVKTKIAEEHEREIVRPHVLEALEIRKGELE